MKEIILNGHKISIETTVNAVGLFCPIPVVSLKKELEQVQQKGVVELSSDDPGVLEEIPAWYRETGNKLLSLQKNEEGVFISYVMKERI